MTANEPAQQARETGALPAAAATRSAAAPEGPAVAARLPAQGWLVLVVGPSGAGKDTILSAARAACAVGGVSFVRRTVTRDATADEDHESLTEAEFEQALAGGAFSFWWEAHGLKYGVPATIEADLAAGLTVVCNTSRAVVAKLRERYEQCSVVLVTAPEEVRRARLAARERASDGDTGKRATRVAPGAEELRPALVIENTRTIDEGAAALLRFLQKPWA